jgi:two-component system response regulator FixJ
MARGESPVHVIDAHEPSREALTRRLRAEGLICRAYANSASFLARLEGAHRGCVVARLPIPDQDVGALIGGLRERGASLPVIVIAGNADVRLAVKVMKAGAADFIEEPVDHDQLLAAVAEGLLAARSMDELAQARLEAIRRKRALTDRERQVLAGIMEGRSSRQIGERLGISPRTVEIHRAHLMAKMRAAALPDLVKMALLADMAAA